MAVEFKNDSGRLRKEFIQLESKNKYLYAIIGDVAQYCQEKFNKNFIITMIFRTQNEQDAIYKGKKNSKGVSYDEKPWTSPHQYWHSFDGRTNHLTKKEIKEITDYVNKKYNEENFYSYTAKNHDVGLGDHFHFQFIMKV